MAGWHTVRPTRVESALAMFLLLLAVVELLLSDEQPAPDLTRGVMAVVPPILVAFSRSAPRPAVAGMAAVLLLGAVLSPTSGTLGAGFAWMTVTYGAGAWLARPWPWAGVLLAAGALSDVRDADRDTADLLIDVAFLAAAFAAGRVVHRRARQADALASRLELADAEREARTREAVHRERAVIARELHDIVAHSVSLMVVQAGTARPAAERVDPELSLVLATIEDSGREALTELRRMLGVLRSDTASGGEPVPGLDRLDDLVEGVRRTGLEVQTTIGVQGAVPPGVALCAYRSVQEGLTNAMRHAAGAAVQVSVTGDGHTLEVRVADGGGDRSATAPTGGGTGLVGLRERVLLCGGRMVAGASGRGYALEVTLPMTDHVLPVAGDGGRP